MAGLQREVKKKRLRDVVAQANPVNEEGSETKLTG